MSAIATVLEQKTAKIRFCVDNVQLADELLPTKSAKLQLEQSLEIELLSLSHSHDFPTIDDTVTGVVNKKIHSLAYAVRAAFSEHRPLQLTPDIIWLTIAQGFAQHANNNAETLRSRFVKHQGKERLTVAVDRFPASPQQWSEKVEEWALQIRDRVGADIYRLLVARLG